MRRRTRFLLAAVLLLLAGATAILLGVDGPLTVAPNLRVRTDTGSGYLLVTAGAYSGADGPYTNFGNIKLRTDQNGYLLVSGTGLTGTISGVSAVGDILLGTGGTSFGRLADVATGQGLISGGVGVAPAWSATPTYSGGLILTGGNLNLTNAGAYYWNTRSAMFSTADKLWSVLDTANLTGLELNVGTPTLGVCTGGTLVAGAHNFGGEVTGNTSGACTINFGTPNFTQTPFCFLNDETTLTAIRISARSTAAITVTGAVSADAFQFFCIGRIGV